MASNLRYPAGRAMMFTEPPLAGLEIKHSVKASIVGIGVTCPITWSIPPRRTERIIPDSIQKFINCTLIHLGWNPLYIARAVKVILGYQEQTLQPNGTDIKRISDHIYTSGREAHRRGKVLESFYWDAMIEVDQKWCAFFEENENFTQASLADWPILKNPRHNQFSCGIPNHIPIRPRRLSFQEASLTLNQTSPGSTSAAYLMHNYKLSVRRDPSGYTLCDIICPDDIVMACQLQKFLACTIFYHSNTWNGGKALAPSEYFLKERPGPAIPDRPELLTEETLFEIIRYIVIHVLEFENPASVARENQYWSHIMDYDYRWLEYGELWDNRLGKFTTNKPRVMDPPPDYDIPRLDRDGRSVLRNHDGRMVYAESTGVIEETDKVYFSGELANEWRMQPRDNRPRSPVTGLPLDAVESGLASFLMEYKESWPILREDLGNPLPVIATDGFLIGKLPYIPSLHPADAVAGQKRARESASASKSRSPSPGSTDSKGDKATEQRRRPQGEQSIGPSSRRGKASGSSLRVGPPSGPPSREVSPSQYSSKGAGHASQSLPRGGGGATGQPSSEGGIRVNLRQGEKSRGDNSSGQRKEDINNDDSENSWNDISVIRFYARESMFSV